jgi:hypothetical protein
MLSLVFSLAFLLLWNLALARVNFPFETTTLSITTDTPTYLRPFDFSSSLPQSYTGPECRPQPDEPGWPTAQEWAALNASVSGRLLRPDPPGIVCYPSTQSFDAAECDLLVNRTVNARFWPAQPLLGMIAWPSGDKCAAAKTPRGECRRGGLPEYVVNVSCVADVQAAVNFARSKGIRLVVK